MAPVQEDHPRRDPPPTSARRHPISARLLLILLALAITGAAHGNGPAESANGTPADEPPLLEGRRICLDPGHDPYYTPGASARTPEGVLNEHDLTLQVALRVREILQARGAAVCLTRTDDGDPQLEPYDYNGNGTIRRLEDLPEVIQPRTDWMNDHGAEIVLSIHFNGHPNAAISGSEVYYSDAEPYLHNNYALAQSVLGHLVAHLNAAGYDPVNRGILSDAYKAEYLRFAHLYGYGPDCHDCRRLLGLGNNPLSRNPGRWQAGALIEVLFLSNPHDLAFLLQPHALDVIARGISEGIVAYAASP